MLHHLFKRNVYGDRLYCLRSQINIICYSVQFTVDTFRQYCCHNPDQAKWKTLKGISKIVIRHIIPNLNQIIFKTLNEVWKIVLNYVKNSGQLCYKFLLFLRETWKLIVIYLWCTTQAVVYVSAPYKSLLLPYLNFRWEFEKWIISVSYFNHQFSLA